MIGEELEDRELGIHPIKTPYTRAQILIFNKMFEGTSSTLQNDCIQLHFEAWPIALFQNLLPSCTLSGQATKTQTM